MRTLVLMAVVAGGVAWWMGWLPETWDARALVTDRANCDSSYPDVCISSPPPHYTCADLEVSSFKVFGDDPHGFDPDEDGIGCVPGQP